MTQDKDPHVCGALAYRGELLLQRGGGGDTHRTAVASLRRAASCGTAAVRRRARDALDRAGVDLHEGV